MSNEIVQYRARIRIGDSGCFAIFLSGLLLAGMMVACAVGWRLASTVAPISSCIDDSGVMLASE